MAQVIGNNQVRLTNGQTVAAQQGGWYDGQQFWGGTLSNPGQINSQSNQQGAGKAVSQQVIAQTAPQNVDFVNNERADVGLPAAPDANNPTPVPTEETVNPQGLNFGGSTGGAFGLAGGTGGTGGGSGIGINGLGGNVPALNLPDLYKSLSDQAGIADIEKSITDKTTAYNDAQSKINDNPYLSEANRTGRQQKLTTDYNNSIKTQQDSLAMKKQDIQTQIDLQTKQFDINSQTAKAALDEFNMLLQSGALAGASGNDIASITAATGISSGEIQAAIKAQTQKDVTTSVSTVDDGKNVYSVVINSKTGQIISKQAISASKPAASSTVGTVPGSASYNAIQTQALNQFVVGKANSYGNLSPSDWTAALNAYLAAGLGTRNDFILQYAAYADPNRGDFASPSGYNFPVSIRNDVVSGKKTVSTPSASQSLLNQINNAGQ